MNQKEKLFFDQLKDIFIGAKIEGESGFINLMRIKSAYFDVIFKELVKEIEAKTEAFPDFKEEMFDKLFTFFKTYFSESGSIYFSYTPLKSKVYEKVYSNNKDVMLFWKTHMLYYVKTDKIWNNLTVDFDEDGVKYKIHFDVSKLEHKKANEKREIIYELKNIKDKEITFKVLYSERGRKTKTDDILKNFKKNKIHLDEERLSKIFRIFEKQNEVDYFINKNAEQFLKEQFSIWLKNYIFDDESDFSEKRLKQLKVLKEIAYKVIDFVAQFEDELVKIWNKPKFVLNSNYVITLDRIKDVKLIEKIVKHKGFEEQTKEWRELGILKAFDKKKLFTNTLNGKELSKEYAKLPIDTKHFDENIKLEILSLFDNLDEELDGWLIHSENYQALKTILPKFQEKVQTCYIDPPYNAKTSEIIYYNVFKHSSWVSLMENRLSLAKELLDTKNGVHIIAIDEHEQENLGKLIDIVFPEMNKTMISVRHNSSGRQGDFFSYNNEFAYFISPPNISANLKDVEEDEQYNISFRKTGTEEVSRSSGKNCFYPIFVKRGKIVGFGNVCKDSFHPKSSNVKRDDGIIEVYPIDSKGEERKWRYSRDNVEEVSKLLVVEKDRNDQITIKKKIVKVPFKTFWDSNKYLARDYGTFLLQKMFNTSNKLFDFPKSLYLVKDSIESSSNNKGLILDYFAGSGTTAHATQLLNKEDGGNRKFILIEMGDHFNTVLIPRVKKVTYSFDWNKGIAKDSNGSGGFFKYYDLEQYEQTLKKAVYKESHPFVDFKDKSIYQQYVFMKDLKLLEAMEIDKKNNKIKIDFSKIYPNIDLAETISCITGKTIKKIEKNAVVLEGNERIEFDKIDFNLVKPLIWW